MNGLGRGGGAARGGSMMNAGRGRGGQMGNNRGVMNGRGGRGGSFISSGGGGRGGGGGVTGPLRGQASRGNFGGGNKDFHSRRGGGSFTGGGDRSAYSHQNAASSRGRGQAHPGRGGRHDSFVARDGQASSSFTSPGKKDENRRTLTDFKIVGLEISELGWTWGVLPSALPIKAESKDNSDILELSRAIVKDEAMEEKMPPNVTTTVEKAAEPSQDEDSGDPSPAIVEPKPLQGSAETSQAVPVVNTSTPPPSRIRIYFHTPVTADDSQPIPHSTSASFTLGTAPSDSRKGKRKKLEDDDGDLEEGRAPPPPPQMGGGMNDDRSSVAASVAASAAETSSEGDWLMAAIVNGDADGAHDGDADGDDQLHISEIAESQATEVADDATDRGDETDVDGELLHIA